MEEFDYTAYLQTASKPLAMERTHNTRDLGYYPPIRPMRFLRSDEPSKLTEQDLDTLAPYHLGLVIDLRTKLEITMAHDYKIPGTRYVNYPLLDGLQDLLQDKHIPTSLSQMYCGLIDNNKETMKSIFCEMLATDQGVLFHCTSGKDRTGIVAMLLLGLAGIDQDLIIADYAVSSHYMAAQLKSLEKKLNMVGLKREDPLLGSEPSAMRETLDHVRDHYGSCEGYLKAIGLDDNQILALKHRLID